MGSKGEVTNGGKDKVELSLREREKFCGASESIKDGQIDLEI
jgi:hypothetical protein